MDDMLVSLTFSGDVASSQSELLRVSGPSPVVPVQFVFRFSWPVSGTALLDALAALVAASCHRWLTSATDGPALLVFPLFATPLLARCHPMLRIPATQPVGAPHDRLVAEDMDALLVALAANGRRSQDVEATPVASSTLRLVDLPLRVDFEERPFGAAPVGPLSIGPTTAGCLAAAATTAAAPFKWRRGAQLGSGACGTVFAAFNEDSGTMMAVKEIALEPGASQLASCDAAFASLTSSSSATGNSTILGERTSILIQTLRREVATLVQFRHPNIVRYYGCECTEDSVHIFMELLSGGTLADVVRDFGPLPAAVVLRYLQQLLGALAALHARGIVHRDIKGANVLLSEQGQVKLADFGCAKNLATSLPGQASVLKGTVLWMAPEVVRSSDAYSPAADLWGLACTALELLTGLPAWPELAEVPMLTAMYRIATAACGPPLPSSLLEVALGESSQSQIASGVGPTAASHALLCFLQRALSLDPNARGTAVEHLVAVCAGN